MKSTGKKQLKSFILIIILFIYILSLSIGYAFFQESLTINGVASTVDYFSGTVLPTSPIILDTTKNHYSTESQHKDFLDWTSETWGTDTFEVHYKKKWGIVIGTKTIDYKISFSNPTNYEYTNGTTQSTISLNNSGGVKTATSSLSSTTIEPGGTVVVTATIKHNFLTRLDSDAVTTVITYNIQGVPRTFTFIVYFDGD